MCEEAGKIKIEYCVGGVTCPNQLNWDVDNVKTALEETFADRSGVEIVARNCMALCRFAEEQGQGNVRVDGEMLLSVDDCSVGVRALQMLEEKYL